MELCLIPGQVFEYSSNVAAGMKGTVDVSYLQDDRFLGEVRLGEFVKTAAGRQRKFNTEAPNQNNHIIPTVSLTSPPF